MDLSTEIRKLSPSNLRELAQILEYAESWKRLMAIIPKKLDKTDYKSDLTLHNLHKYHSEHFRLIENASIKLHRTCTEILFDEWGTSGRIRPALGHLLYLLKKAEIFRAADYVATTLLGLEPPERPSQGPAALVKMKLTESIDSIENELDNMRYPSSESLNNNSNHDTNIENSSIDRNVPHVIPKIVISETPTLEISTLNMPPLIIQKKRCDSITNRDNNISNSSGTLSTNIDNDSILLNNNETSEGQISDMMKFTQAEVNGDTDLPNLSIFNIKIENLESDQNIPAFSQIISENNISTENAVEIMETNIPAFSIIMIEENSNTATTVNSNINESIVTETIPAFSIILNQENNKSNLDTEDTDDIIPDFSGNLLLNEPSIVNEVISCFNVPAFDMIMSEDNVEESSETSFPNNIPDMIRTTEELLTNSKLSTPCLALLQNSTSSSNSSTSRPHCTSPLPNLSLNTILPHYSYYELEKTTNNFDETLHQNSLDMQYRLSGEMENSLSESNGRFLGSGAFGAVFLALNLLDKPIAVKKLFLNDDVEVNIDDAITKQFRNEVEILCKYKHSNLLDIVGYSCDGPTYCLMYEYISGGALKERLEKYRGDLLWKDRLAIAAGTAEAVAYLHTALATPLIHRDIKTANILLDCSNKPKLGDFGIIKLSPNQNTTVSTTIIGTSVYMAPEAFRSGDVSVKTDSFSFGVVLLELLTALSPLDENREARDLISHVEDTCEENTILPLLDKEAGTWYENDINIADAIFSIANKCLEEKKKRPNMVEVKYMLAKLLDTII